MSLLHLALAGPAGCLHGFPVEAEGGGYSAVTTAGVDRQGYSSAQVGCPADSSPVVPSTPPGAMLGRVKQLPEPTVHILCLRNAFDCSHFFSFWVPE